MQQHTSEAEKLLADLDAELAQAAVATGESLVWSAAEAEAREIIANTVDRRAYLLTRYERVREIKTKLKISAEIRLLDRSVMAVLKGIRTDIPQPESLTTIKNRRAANIRWDKARRAEA